MMPKRVKYEMADKCLIVTRRAKPMGAARGLAKSYRYHHLLLVAMMLLQARDNNEISGAYPVGSIRNKHPSPRMFVIGGHW